MTEEKLAASIRDAGRGLADLFNQHVLDHCPQAGPAHWQALLELVQEAGHEALSVMLVEFEGTETGDAAEAFLMRLMDEGFYTRLGELSLAGMDAMGRA